MINRLFMMAAPVVVGLTVLATGVFAQIMPGIHPGSLMLKADPSGEINLGGLGVPYVACFFMPGDKETAEEVKALQDIISGSSRLNRFKILMITKGRDEDERKRARDYLRDSGINAILVFDPENAGGDAFKADKFPLFFIVDEKGILRSLPLSSVKQTVRKRSFSTFLEIVADGGDIPMVDMIPWKNTGRQLLDLIGKPSPDFFLPDISGKMHRLSDTKGKNAIIVFWNIDCPHCIDELPLLNEFYIENKDKYNLEVLAVALCRNRADEKRVADFAGKAELEFPVLLSSKTVSSKYRIRHVPTSFFINSEMVITDLAVGLPEHFSLMLKSLLEDPLRLGARAEGTVRE
ncbi:MAG: redoxin domain-containing protein [Deltaproteobacteria bacterium]|nr:redoxin domain-containing protein [Deltaproteobacteria bacterium]